MSDSIKETLISGKTIKSTMLTISSLGEIGEKILHTSGFDVIDTEKWYPHELRILLLDEIYNRFDNEAIYFIGLKNILSFGMNIKGVQEIEEIYLNSIKSQTAEHFFFEALGNVNQQLINLLSEAINVNTRGNHNLYGVTLKKITPTHFNITVSAAIGLKHEAFFRSAIDAVLSLCVLNEWKFDNKFKSVVYAPDLCMTSYEYECIFYRHKSEKSPAELLLDLQINAGDALLKKVVIDSDRSLKKSDQSLMKLNASHKLVVESVNYASRLQRGQLPRQERIDGRFSSFASIWEPRDTISGDLYWLSSSQQSGAFVLAVADCTGHGVPGAMLSLLVSNSLERIYANDATEDPASALMSLDHYVRTGLNQDRADSESDDGCDAAVLRIDRDKQTIEFAGAKLGLFQVSVSGVLTRHLGSRCSLGYQDAVAQADKPVVQKIPYQSGDVFAVVTDGFTDQIGGTTGKMSFGYRRLEEILKANCTFSAEEIAAAMKLEFAAWQGANARRDDVTAVVFRL